MRPLLAASIARIIPGTIYYVCVCVCVCVRVRACVCVCARVCVRRDVRLSLTYKMSSSYNGIKIELILISKCAKSVLPEHSCGRDYVKRIM